MKTVLLLIIFFGDFAYVYGSFYIGALNNFKATTSHVWLYVTTTSSMPVRYNVELFNGNTASGEVSKTTPRKDRYSPSLYVTTDSSYSNRQKGIFVTSESFPISLLVVNYELYTVGEYLAFENDFAINKYQYYAVSTGTIVSDVSSEVLLVGNSDDTTVTIIPSQSVSVPQDIQDSNSPLITVTAGTPYTISIHRLQTFMFTSPLDLSGTSIVSDKPLTVISGHECGNVPSGCCCEHLTMQIPPTVTWGKRFLLTPYSSRPRQYYKVIAANSETIIKYTCGSSVASRLVILLSNAGDVSVLSSNNGIYCSLVSNKPVLVAQLGPSYNVGNNGDPVISMIPPIDHYSMSLSFISLEFDFTAHYINIAAESKITIEMDGQSLSLTWNTIYDSNGNIFGYGAQVPITVSGLDSHTLSSTSKFSTLVYGFSVSSGYSYSAGVSINKLVFDPLQIKPGYGHILGGVPVLISGPTFEVDDDVKVSFYDTEVDCDVLDQNYAICITPKLAKAGQVSVKLYHESNLYLETTTFYSNPIAGNNQVSISSDKLLFYANEEITLTWSPESLTTSFEQLQSVQASDLNIDIKLYIFQMSNDVLKLQDTLISDVDNNGLAAVTLPMISGEAAQVAIISIEAKGSFKPFNRADRRVTQWTDIIWITSSDAVLHSACVTWSDNEPRDIDNDQLLYNAVRSNFPCPRFGFQAESIISGFIGVTNTKLMSFFHNGASKCFNQRTRNAGGTSNECCYDDNDILIFGSPTGGSVKKVSIVGSTGLNYFTDLINHQFEDVLPFIHCCKGTLPNCRAYYDRRPSDNGNAYVPPQPARQIGDPHIVTLDQHKYTFNGKGEFVLIETNDQSFTLQGRMVEAKTLMGDAAKGTVFSAFVVKEENSNIVQFEIQTANNITDIIVLINGRRINFDELKSQEFDNVTVTDSGNKTLSATFSSGAFIEAKEQNGFMSVIVVSLPRSYQNKTQGLLGPYNGDKTDDLTPNGNKPMLPLNSTLRKIHEEFGVTWIITNSRDSLFTYQFGQNWSTFYFPFFTPAYEPTFSDPSLKQKADEICGDDEYCKFDIAATGRVEIGEATIQAEQEFEELLNLSKPVSCSPPCIHGVCVDTNVCVCSEGYTGDTCNITVFLPCDPNPCNGGTCQYHAGSYICKCLPGLSGDFCREELKSLCHQPPEVGTCKGAFPRWFYNISSGQCEIFAYGGCKGNENRFQSLGECHDNCRCPFGVKPKKCSSNVCDSSVCTAYPDAICFLDECSDCSPRYLMGNIDVTEFCDLCSLVPDSGPCNNNSSRWYYNRAAGRCFEFTYGGCGGNQNNFESLSKCLKQCGFKCEKNVEPVQCLYDPCIIAQCLNLPNTTCVSYSCGQCSARFYNTSGHDVTSSCFSCPPNKPQMFCPESLCNLQSCSNFPNAQCVIDNCGQCKATFIENGTDVTDQCRCSVEGAIFKPCGSTCVDTCSSRKMNAQIVCLPHCKPGCACPAGQIVDDYRNKCVYPDQCYCPPCDPVPANCSNIIKAQNDTCGCPICGDCPIEGQEYQDNRTCPKTCDDPDVFCIGNGPGCGCPPGQLIDKDENQCVHPSNCSNSSLCHQPPVRGPCQGAFTRYFYNVNNRLCKTFIYGGCNGNENNFLSLHQCQQSCSNCPPTCTKEFCTIERNAICSLSNSDCEIDDCAITNCQACYYSYNELPMPSNCSQNCENPFDEVCMIEWGRCVRQRFLEDYNEIIPVDINFPGNFHCWNNKPCRLPN